MPTSTPGTAIGGSLAVGNTQNRWQWWKTRRFGTGTSSLEHRTRLDLDDPYSLLFLLLSLISSTFHRNSLATPFDARLIAAVHLRRMLARYDTLLKANSDRPEGPDSPPLINLRDLFVAVESELTEWGIFWTGEIKAMSESSFLLSPCVSLDPNAIRS